MDKKTLIEKINHYAKVNELKTSEIGNLNLKDTSLLLEEYKIPGILVQYESRIGFVLSYDESSVTVYNTVKGIEEKLDKNQIEKAKVVTSNLKNIDCTDNWDKITECLPKDQFPENPKMGNLNEYTRDHGLMSIVGLHIGNLKNSEYDGVKFVQHYSNEVNRLRSP